MRTALPTVCVVFYDYFFRSSTGDSAWRKKCADHSDMTAEMGRSNEQAFALVLLKNNYFAWLYHAKGQMKGHLITDYDSEDARQTHKTVNEGYLRMEINMEESIDLEQDLLVHPGTELYEEMKKDTERKMKLLQGRSKDNKEYKRVVEQLEEGSDSKEEDSYINRKKKRRKLREFKEYTTQKEGEGRFKGWSSRAAIDMSKIVSEIIRFKDEQTRFNVAYRQICKHREKNKGKPAVQEKVALEVARNCEDLETIGLPEL
jgi:hypothetical protein